MLTVCLLVLCCCVDLLLVYTLGVLVCSLCFDLWNVCCALDVLGLCYSWFVECFVVVCDLCFGCCLDSWLFCCYWFFVLVGLLVMFSI